MIFEILNVVIAAAVSSVAMRIKGGGVITSKMTLINGRDASSIIIACLVFFLCGNPIIGVLCGAAWWLGCAPDVSDYIQILGGYKGSLNFTAYGTVTAITKILEEFIEDFNVKLTAKNIRLIYGLGGMTLRGLIFGIPLAVATLNPVMLIAGICMPHAYYVGVSLRQKQLNRRTVDGWHYGEWNFGFIIGVCLGFAFTNFTFHVIQ